MARSRCQAHKDMQETWPRSPSVPPLAVKGSSAYENQSEIPDLLSMAAMMLKATVACQWRYSKSDSRARSADRIPPRMGFCHRIARYGATGFGTHPSRHSAQELKSVVFSSLPRGLLLIRRRYFRDPTPSARPPTLQECDRHR